jgi:hypothetical protein
VEPLRSLLRRLLEIEWAERTHLFSLLVIAGKHASARPASCLNPDPSCTGIGQDRNTTSPNGFHPGITLGPGTGTRPEIHKETDEPWIPLKRCLGTATLAAPCPFCQAHGNLITQANRLSAAGAAPQVFSCERV